MTCLLGETDGMVMVGGVGGRWVDGGAAVRTGVLQPQGGRLGSVCTRPSWLHLGPFNP